MQISSGEEEANESTCEREGNGCSDEGTDVYYIHARINVIKQWRVCVGGNGESKKRRESSGNVQEEVVAKLKL